MLRIPIFLLFMLVLSGSTRLLGVPRARSDPQTPGQVEEYAGAEACQGCHDEVYGKFSATAHEKLLANTDPAKQGCEACHGPGAVHVDTNGDLERIFRFSQAKPSVVRTRCLACHEAPPGDVHTQHQISCLKCHSAHHYTEAKSALAQDKARLCTSCHS